LSGITSQQSQWIEGVIKHRWEHVMDDIDFFRPQKFTGRDESSCQKFGVKNVFV
jgi:hypothetical protein